MKLDLEINKGFKLHYASRREKPKPWFRASEDGICTMQPGHLFTFL
jgi:hypothetical protein